MIHSIFFNKFRQFKNINVRMAKYITIIGGGNTTGKSTLLGIICNSMKLNQNKKKYKSPILQNKFSADFNDMFKASKKHDKKGSDLFTINVSAQQSTSSQFKILMSE